MAKEEKEQEKKAEKELKTAKDASIDFPVEVIATEADPYHETGAKFHAGKKKADELVKRGWVKMAMIALLIVASICASGQASVYAPLYNAKTTTTLATIQAATGLVDTVTNTGTGFLYSKRISGPGSVTISVKVTKVSGTVGGTLTLYGSNDAANVASFVAIKTEETQTAIATATAADATGTYSWRIKTSPYLYYSVGYAGTGTMVATFTGNILKH